MLGHNCKPGKGEERSLGLLHSLTGDDVHKSEADHEPLM